MLNDMNISGIGIIAKGEYNKVNISGVAKILGEIKSKSLDVSGTAKSFGNINSDDITISGSFRSNSNIECKDKFEINGTLTCDKEIKGNDIRINGYAKVLSKIQFDKLEVNGGLKALEGAEGRRFLLDGAIKIGGLLSADNISINVFKTSKVKEIGGEDIVIKKGNQSVFSSIFFRSKVISDLIEGDKIYVEKTVAKIVRGEDITIGEGCVIDRVEYTKNLNILEGAKVKEKILIK
ncbi:polymer-forming cytoskeletal protein [Clostridium baratii]